MRAEPHGRGKTGRVSRSHTRNSGDVFLSLLLFKAAFGGILPSLIAPERALLSHLLFLVPLKPNSYAHSELSREAQEECTSSG